MDYLFVTCASNLEALLEEELKQLGITNVRAGFRGVSIPKSEENVFIVNYLSRVATRVLWPLIRFSCRNKEDLYYSIKRFPWHDWIPPHKTFAIDPNVHHSAFPNSLYAAQVTKDAICDAIKTRLNKRPSVELQNPDVQLNLFIKQEDAVLYFDTSGQPLFKRGWRKASVEAPIQEVLAASILKMAGYTPDACPILCDPFCGSGTIPIEALMIQRRIPPGYYREKFGFMNILGFDKRRWQAFKKPWDESLLPGLTTPILANDKDPKALDSLQKNIAPFAKDPLLYTSCKDISGFFPKVAPNLVITNLPYGVRLQSYLRHFEGLSTFLNQRCAPHAKAYIVISSLEGLTSLPIKILSTTKLMNGGIEVFLVELSVS